MKTKKVNNPPSHKAMEGLANLEAANAGIKVARANKFGKLVAFGWMLLLLGGLGHMLPEQMAPVLKWAIWGVSFQTAVGVLSVIVSLYYLLEE